MRTYNTISISVKLYASLAEYKPVEADSPEFTMEMDAKISIEELIEQLKIPLEKIKMISLNDKLVKNGVTLSNGDRIVLFSTIAGG